MGGGTLESMYVCMCVCGGEGGGLLHLEPNEKSFKDSYWKYYFLEFYKIKKKKKHSLDGERERWEGQTSHYGFLNLRQSGNRIRRSFHLKEIESCDYFTGIDTLIS